MKKISKTDKISEQNPKEAEMEAGIVARQAIFQIVVKDEWKTQRKNEMIFGALVSRMKNEKVMTDLPHF